MTALLDLCYTEVEHSALGNTWRFKAPSNKDDCGDFVLRNTWRCKGRSNEEKCDALALGSLIKGLSRINLWPRPSISKITASVDELSTMLKKLSLHTYPTIDQGYHVDVSHKQCNISNTFHCKVDGILEEKAKGVMTDTFRRHLEAQSKK